MAKYRKYKSSKTYMSGGQIGSTAGALLGSIIPGVGTAIGGGIGGMLGGLIGGNKNQELTEPPMPVEPAMRFENGGKKESTMVSADSPEYRKAYEEGRVQGQLLPEIDVVRSGNTTANNPIANAARSSMNTAAQNTFAVGKNMAYFSPAYPLAVFSDFADAYAHHDPSAGAYTAAMTALPHAISGRFHGPAELAAKMLKTPGKNFLKSEGVIGNHPMEMGGMLTPIEAGGSHSENGLGGVPIGNNASVEQGETMTEDFVYSDKLKINKTLAKEFSLPKSTIGKTFAQASKSLTIDQEDVISQRGNKRMLNRIAEAQEAYKQSFGDKYYQNEQPTVQMVHGGPHDGPYGIRPFHPDLEGIGMQGLGMQDDYLGGMPMGTMANTQGQQAVTPAQQTTSQATTSQTTPAPSVTSGAQQEAGTPATDVPAEAVDPQVTVQSEDGQTLRSLNLNTNLFGNQNQFSAFNTPSLGFGQTPVFNPLDPFGLNRINQGLNLRTGGSDTSTTNVSEGAADETGAANTEDTALGKARFSALRYAPIASDIYSLATADRPTPMDPSRYQQFGTFTENLVDRAQARKDAMDAASTTAQYLQEASGGNAALFSAMMQGADTRSQRALGNLSYQQDIADAQEKARVEGLKNRQQMMNAQIRQQIDIQNQQDQAAYSNMMQDSLTNLAQNIANVGTEQTRMSQVNQLFGYDVYGQYKNAVKDGTTSAKSISEYIQGLIGN